MKTLLVTNRTAVMFNPDDQSLKTVNEDRGTVRSVFLVPEECDIKYTYWNSKDRKDVEGTMHANAGDILVNFWDDDFTQPWILVKSDEWKGNIEAYRTAEQRRKEEWAAKHADSDNLQGDNTGVCKSDNY